LKHSLLSNENLISSVSSLLVGKDQTQILIRRHRLFSKSESNQQPTQNAERITMTRACSCDDALFVMQH
jgi:hypothetical protein